MKAKYVIAGIAALLVTAALSVPVIQVTIQQLGVGASEVLSPAGRAWVNFVLAAQGGVKLVSVKVKFDKPLSSGTFIRVELRDSSDEVLAAGEVALGSDLEKGQWLTVDISPDLDVWDLMKVEKVVLVVAGSEIGL